MVPVAYVVEDDRSTRAAGQCISNGIATGRSTPDGSYCLDAKTTRLELFAETDSKAPHTIATSDRHDLQHVALLHCQGSRDKAWLTISEHTRRQSRSGPQSPTK